MAQVGSGTLEVLQRVDYAGRVRSAPPNLRILQALETAWLSYLQTGVHIKQYAIGDGRRTTPTDLLAAMENSARWSSRKRPPRRLPAGSATRTGSTSGLTKWHGLPRRQTGAADNCAQGQEGRR
jgi:hypothetical protein